MRVSSAAQIDFGFPVPDALVGAFGHISDGDVFFQRNLYADALDCYNRCIDSPNAFEGAVRCLDEGGIAAQRRRRRRRR